MTSVFIRGRGVAASCCAHLLRRAGISVTTEPGDRAKLPAILLGEATQALIRDVFDQPELFRALPRIERRVVTWGPDSEEVTLPHSAVVVSEQQLCDLLHPAGEAANQTGAPSWNIVASRPLPSASSEHAFGTRKATALRVTLRNDSHPAACRIESTADGWLFLIPTSGGDAWLLSVGATPLALLERSRLRAHIQTARTSGAEFPAYPRIVWPLAEPGQICCGAAALAFDPLCGDGTGHAIREGILAAAVVQVADGGADLVGVLEHYSARLLAGFRRHLDVCQSFYMSGGDGPWWQAELASIRRGIAWCDSTRAPGTGFRYRLDGFELRPIITEGS
jgi:flavin-dependent dehydrogenase